MKLLERIISVPLLLVSWTGWTKEDYISFFKKFDPRNLGWSEDEWEYFVGFLGCIGIIVILVQVLRIFL